MAFGISSNAFSAEVSTQQALLLEEKSAKYGAFEKDYKNAKLEDKNSDFSEILKKDDRKEPSVLDVFNALIFVIFLILLTGWIFMKVKKINPEQLLSGKFNKLSENNFKIVSSLQLGAGKAIYLIEINDTQLIVGTTASNVNLLAKMDKTEKQEEIPKECIEKLFNSENEEFKNLEE